MREGSRSCPRGRLRGELGTAVANRRLGFMGFSTDPQPFGNADTTELAVPKAARAPGDRIAPGIRLLRKIASGGTSEVWAARDDEIAGDVAVKILARGLHEDPLARERFRRAAAAVTAVRSAHVVRHFDHGTTSEGIPFVVMELLEGETLADRLARGPLPPAEAAELAVQAAHALDVAHGVGVVHRDIKPQNLFLGPGPAGFVVRVLDFGVAVIDGARVTAPGTIVGTPSYSSPEQLCGDGPCPGDDIWSLAVVAFEALTGRLPFDAQSYVRLVSSILERRHRRPSELAPHLGKEVDRWFYQATHAGRDRRFQSADDLACALRTAVRQSAGPAPSPPPRSSAPPSFDPGDSGRYSYVAPYRTRRSNGPPRGGE
jgi:serine/threonine-protein kinase